MKSVVDEYLANVTPKYRKELERIRSIVLKEVPEASEVISYGMPGFKYKQKYFVGYAAFKDHLSFFPTSGPIEALNRELQEFTLSKGTIQFTPEHNIPEPLLKKLIQYRQSQIKN